MASHGIYAHGFISWIVLIHRIMGIHGPGCVPWLLFFQESIYSWDSVSWNLAIPGLFLFIESLGFFAMGFFYSWNHWDSWPWICSWAYVYASYYWFIGFYFVECCYSWIVLIHRIHSFCGWNVWPGFFSFLETILFYALAWCYGFMASHGIYGHGLISWIHSIHDLGSFSFGSGIFLFRIYVLLMSWHTSRILFRIMKPGRKVFWLI